MFEILATLCLSGLCVEHVMPQPLAMTQTQCEATLEASTDRWIKAHAGYTLETAACVSLQSLQGRAATVVEISPGQFVHKGLVADFSSSNQGDIANTGFIVGSEQVAVIDAGTTRGVAEALYLAVRLHSDLPIRFCLLTHMHPDHTLGAAVFREAGAKIIGAQRLAEALGTRNEIYRDNLQRIVGDKAFHATHPILPDHGVTDEEIIDLGSRPLQLRAWGTAHTTNDLTIVDTSSNTIWMGDLVFLEHAPALDGSITGWVKLLSDARQLSYATIVPGHGPVSANFPQGLQPTLDYLVALRRQTRQAIDSGESLATALKHVGNDLRGQWVQFDQFNPRNVTNAYVELEWE